MRIGALLERSIPWRWALYWLLIPNIVIILMWPIGGPSMKNVLLLFGFAALLISQLPWSRVKQVLLLAMMSAVMAHYICLMFNLPIWAIQYLPSFLSEVRPWRAPFYLLGGLLFLGVVVFTLRQAPCVKRFPSFVSMLAALLTVYAFSMIDSVATAATKESYHTAPGPGQPFQSATGMAGFDNPAMERRHVLIVVVEALGKPVGKMEEGLFNADWNRPRWHERYVISHGSVPYYGSTTSAELRELCGVWGQYMRFDFAKADCLPQRYRQAGYQTSAMHSFANQFFDRAHWYPKLHFERIEFGPDLVREGVPVCGGMFPGACDKDIPSLIGKRLKAATKPQLMYWLTLNSHLPVVEDSSLGTEDCVFGSGEWSANNPQICRLFLVQHQLANALDAMVMDPELPPTDILIVGDHMPPFFDRDSRARFDGSQVPWILLRSRGASDRSAVPAASS